MTVNNDLKRKVPAPFTLLSQNVLGENEENHKKCR